MFMVKESIKKIIEESERIHAAANDLAEESSLEKFVERSFALQAMAEKLCQRARLLPIKTGYPKAPEVVRENAAKLLAINVVYERGGWAKIDIPALLPKKEKGGVEYIRDSVSFGLETYFANHERKTFNALSMLVFHHVYSKEYPLRALRDHDNIEINAVADLIAGNFLIDDGPMVCHHMQYTSIGLTDMTEIYIVPSEKMFDWMNEIYLNDIKQQI